MPLLTNAQLAAVQSFGLQGMTTPVTIKRRVVSESVYGDDDVSFVTVTSTVGWMFSHPTPVQTQDAASVITVNTYRLFLPVGTDVLPGDRAEIAGTSYIVSDTTHESTWNAVLSCSLRKRE